MTKSVDIFFDYVCPYCYIASKREAILKQEFDLNFNWKPWEIHPERPLKAGTRDYINTSFVVRSLADEIKLDVTMPRHISNSRNALLGMLYAKGKGRFDDYHHAVFRAHWEEKKDISDMSVLREISSKIGVDPDELERAIANPDFARILDQIDKEAAKRRVELVPSYMIDNKIVVGNVPLERLRRALEKFSRG